MIVSGSLPRDKFARMLKNSQAITSTKELEADGGGVNVDHETLSRQPAAVRFQAEHSNDRCQFDLSPSYLEEIKEPLWLQPIWSLLPVPPAGRLRFPS
jgi:hypothetical protein